MDVLVAGFKGNARSPSGHVEGIGHPHDPAFDGERVTATPVTDDRVQGLGGDDRTLGLLVDVMEEARQLVGTQEQAVALVILTMDRHAHAMEETGGRHDHLRVSLAEGVVGDDVGHDAAPEEQPGQPQPDVEHDLDVDPACDRTCPVDGWRSRRTRATRPSAAHRS
jgi:hypothetical protein